jgi:hypothetical protein
VRDVGHEAPPQLLVARQGFGEAVEVLGEPAELVARADRDARRVVAGGEPVRGVGDATDRLQECARQNDRDQRGQPEREGGDDPRGAQLFLLKCEVGGGGNAPVGRARDPADDAIVDQHRAHRSAVTQLRIADHRALVRVEERQALHRLRRGGEAAQPAIVALQEAPAAVAAVLVAEPRRERLQALRLDMVEIAEEPGLEGKTRRDRHRGRRHRARGEDGEEQLEGNPRLHLRMVPRRGGRINLAT